MSENLDLVRSLRAAWDRGDFGASEWAHPDIEYVIVERARRRTAAGLPGMAKLWREFLADWKEWRAHTVEVRELDRERVLALVDLSGHHRATGRSVGEIGGTRGANLFHLRDSKVTKFVLYLERDRALADLGGEAS